MMRLKHKIKRVIFRDLYTYIMENQVGFKQIRKELNDWMLADLVDITNEFVKRQRIPDSCFIKRMNKAFDTMDFQTLLKKWVSIYYYDLLCILDNAAFSKISPRKPLVLIDMPLNRFIYGKYFRKFNISPEIKWLKQPALFSRLATVLWEISRTLYGSLSSGIRFSRRKKQYKVMRESIMGLSSPSYDEARNAGFYWGGVYFCDDFLIDENKIKTQDVLFFTRANPHDCQRLKAYGDIKRSAYQHFDLKKLAIGIDIFFLRVIPKYLFSGSLALLHSLSSADFLLFSNIFHNFTSSALPYEKVFSNYKVGVELGHNYFSFHHIPEAIICRAYGTKYYFFQLSDNTVLENKLILAFLSCDKLLVWGKDHVFGVECEAAKIFSIGYVFKEFIHRVSSEKSEFLSRMGISAKNKVVTFFDEAFGTTCIMTDANFVTFWETILEIASRHKDTAVIIREKLPDAYLRLPEDLKRSFLNAKARLEKAENVHILDSRNWSFIEAIGVADIVITQGMTSSATIAVVSGINGLYLDQAGFSHPFSRLYKNKLFFDDPAVLMDAVDRIIADKESPISDIPENIMRGLDEYPDDRAINLLRDTILDAA